MIYMKFEFDEDKLYEDDRNLKGAFSWLDRIATKCKLDKFKIYDGYYESKDNSGFKAFMNIIGVLSNNENIKQYCIKWDYFDDEDSGLENILEKLERVS